MIIAVFGDVHGNLAAMFDCCLDWQNRYAKQIDLILQTGDMGLWCSFNEADKATPAAFCLPLRLSTQVEAAGESRSGGCVNDKTELAAAPYLSGKKTAPIETWFINGNHENFSLLANKENQPVDPARLGEASRSPTGRIIFLSPGSVREFRKDKEILRVAALGGIEYRFGKYPVPSNARVQKYLHPPSLEDLQKTNSKVDVLLLHDAPLNKGLRTKFPTGSKRITELIQTLQPRFAFYGHYDDPPEPFYVGPTLCVGTNFARAKRIPGRDGAMGILRTDTWQFRFVEP